VPRGAKTASRDCNHFAGVIVDGLTDRQRFVWTPGRRSGKAVLGSLILRV
jgi:hypothetical protein